MMTATALRLADTVERDDLGAFTARAVRLDPTAQVRLRSAGERVTAWASTPFDVLATRSVRGTMKPEDVTVPGSALLTALAVERAETIDPGPSGGPWQPSFPPDEGWSIVGDVPAAELERLTERGLALAREHAGPLGPPTSLLDQTVLTVQGESGPAVKVPTRCLFALSGMGFLGAAETCAPELVRVSATPSWLRLDARYGAVVRRRITALPLMPLRNP
ncbi:hypothetical protein [Pseudonocardia asaccharolytica]|uniref:Uncharacterized protein n=1 Tax=Pseudonocardia asaccharolytica DSM 44247 = NBRC 16224 TaxID=1123024 RepID=A0A511D7W9_9PSEU|nr:hypothetical protein [Pseudonocardia asaccharolytica]GEL20901.1 hypothetical protein PA7_47380 [Pseudonocardia asaccharolytica DSM 44247 = NBRC 16224]